MKRQNSSKGKEGEIIAVNHLKNNGFVILETNWRYSRLGEIDIIAKDKNTLVFIEVKSRTSSLYGHPFESVSEKKFDKIKKLAEIYLTNNKEIKFDDLRFDIIGILLKEKPEVSYLKNVY